ncbi:hypothetical protein CC86DRAFT_419362 [Ophiobolus disseminans]|uniref:Uncharacterized protein n=1 Tax=Ophiobolus disseminans TaxID=1469910 RepID=A0A6A6ZX20_9PLEO|nr:hypothetical protein CC86DRAFT_419362 [Ophiobolus disseminans]
MFKPLSTAYSTELTNHLHQSQGLVPIKKGDFFLLFWKAWRTVFTNTELVRKSFEATRVWPKNRQVVLKRFNKQTSDRGLQPSSPVGLNENTWLQLERLLRATVADKTSNEARALGEKLHHFQVENELLHYENKGLRKALKTKKKHKKTGRALDLQQHEEYHGGAVFWSPRAIREARYRESVRGQEEERLQLQKADAKKLRESNNLLKKKLAEEKRVAREEAKVVRERERAEKAAARTAKIEADNTRKAIKQSQVGKRKALSSSWPKAKRVRASGGDGGVGMVEVAAPPPPPRISSSGRAIKPTRKFK